MDAALFKEPLHFTLHVFLPDSIAFIMQFFSFAQTDLHFYEILVGKINPQWHKCISFLFQLRLNLADLFFMQQQFAVVYRLMIVEVSMRVFSDVQRLHPYFALMHLAIAVVKTYLASADRFHFRSGQHHACIVCGIDEKVVEC